ncbi:DUF3347 domain-containing protein [Mucilaginibacter aquatilis]|uniref:DUF3347 domain-containing protein n=1 Tax=Mucilaginibacter aquatilis TaxID=1517760 RepID=A0A6I4IPU7_9SPHI|nr:DUF3347 domain-containing protein [Mucilaginibacter aquatilis]MVN90633.1 DUF3347 domain-containing protein [Mucilaginibacter aquatilis]
MKLVSKLVVLAVLLATQTINAQIKNSKTVSFKVYGNCEMCQSAIEKAGTQKNVANVNWSKDTQMATLNYDSQKTGADDILKRIALAGYDSETFLAPDDVYAKLPECCRYSRDLKPAASGNKTTADVHANHNAGSNTAQQKGQLQGLFDNYFALKDALVSTDAVSAAQKATAMSASIKAVDMSKLSAKEHEVWMKTMKNIAAGAEAISASKNIAKQRSAFINLSDNIYELVKATENNQALYYQHCPMFNSGKGANWLSKEEEIKNPYYGSQMLNCGSVKETIGSK